MNHKKELLWGLRVVQGLVVYDVGFRIAVLGFQGLDRRFQALTQEI